MNCPLIIGRSKAVVERVSKHMAVLERGQLASSVGLQVIFEDLVLHELQG
jgi:hypothetical protein